MGRLSDYHVVVTRPQPQNDTFCQLMLSEGAQITSLPLLATRPIALSSSSTEALLQAGSFHSIIYISTHAVQHGMVAFTSINAINSHSDIDTHRNTSLTRIRQYHHVAIGAKTASSLQQHGLSVHLQAPSPYNSEALLSLPEYQDITGETVLIVKGMGGRNYLKDTLTSRGAKVKEAIVYERYSPLSANTITQTLQALVLNTHTPKSGKALHDYRQIGIIALTSIECAKNLFSSGALTILFNADDRSSHLHSQPIFLAGSDRIAQYVQKNHPLLPIITAKDPTDKSMLQALLSMNSPK